MKNCIKILSILALTYSCLSCSNAKKIHSKKSLDQAIINLKKLENWIEYDYQKNIIPDNLASEYYSIVDLVILQLELIDSKKK